MDIPLIVTDIQSHAQEIKALSKEIKEPQPKPLSVTTASHATATSPENKTLQEQVEQRLGMHSCVHLSRKSD